MSTDKIDPSKKDTTVSSAIDHPATRSDDRELSEKDLDRATGGITVTNDTDVASTKLLYD
jgi:hypothetical protein